MSNPSLIGYAVLLSINENEREVVYYPLDQKEELQKFYREAPNTIVYGLGNYGLLYEFRESNLGKPIMLPRALSSDNMISFPHTNGTIYFNVTEENNQTTLSSGSHRCTEKFIKDKYTMQAEVRKGLYSNTFIGFIIITPAKESLYFHDMNYMAEFLENQYNLNNF